MERVAASKKRHSIDAKEEQMRAERERHTLETEVAAANAKIHELEASASRNGSRAGLVNW